MSTVPVAGRIEVVLPAYNEATSIAGTVREFYHVAHDVAGFPVEFVVCEDGSSDNTRDVAASLASDLPVRVLSSARRKGYRRAVADGLRDTTCDLIGFIDGDGQCDPADFARLHAALDSHDIVIGRRTPRRDALPRRLMSRAFGAVYRALFSVPVSDPSCPFLIMRRTVIEPVLTKEFGLLSQGFWWEFIARASAAGLTIAEIPVHHRPRAAGKTQNFRARRIPRIAAENLRGLVRLHAELSHGDDVPARATPGRSLRILEIATEAPPCRGGVSRTVSYLADGLREQGHTVDVLAYPAVPRLRLGEVRLSAMILRAPRLRRSLDDYDIVHIHGATPTLSDIALITAATVRDRPPVVYTHHADLDLGAFKWPSQAYNRLHTRLTGTADAIACSTPVAAREFARSGPAAVIPLGVDLRQFSGGQRKAGPFTVLYVGQFRPWKSVPVLLRAVARVPGARLIIAGTGPEESHYRKIAADLGLDPEFRIDADDDALRNLYQRAHVIVVPSTARMEAFGLALIEGMAAGCVPVASDLPGVRDVVQPVGFTFPPGDAGALAVILEKLRDDPELVRRIAGQAPARAAQFSCERTVSAYEELFRRLTGIRAGAEPESAARGGRAQQIRAGPGA